MREWTDAETRELIALWPTTSAAQIGKRLNRPLSAISGKAKRLRDDGLLPPSGVVKHFVNPWWARAKPEPTAKPTKPATVRELRHGGADSPVPLDMQPCALVELDERRCHWPLGEVHQVATLFCGGDAEPGRRYCAHHGRRAARS
jgi:hypothetical protein